MRERSGGRKRVLGRRGGREWRGMREGEQVERARREVMRWLV